MHRLAVAASAKHRQLLHSQVAHAQALHMQESPRTRQLRREALRAAGRRVEADFGRMRGFLQDMIRRKPPRNMETLVAYAAVADMLRRLQASVEELQHTAEDSVGGCDLDVAILVRHPAHHRSEPVSAASVRTLSVCEALDSYKLQRPDEDAVLGTDFKRGGRGRCPRRGWRRRRRWRARFRRQGGASARTWTRRRRRRSASWRTRGRRRCCRPR